MGSFESGALASCHPDAQRGEVFDEVDHGIGGAKDLEVNRKCLGNRQSDRQIGMIRGARLADRRRRHLGLGRRDAIRLRRRADAHGALALRLELIDERAARHDHDAALFRAQVDRVGAERQAIARAAEVDPDLVAKRRQAEAPGAVEGDAAELARLAVRVRGQAHARVRRAERRRVDAGQLLLEIDGDPALPAQHRATLQRRHTGGQRAILPAAHRLIDLLDVGQRLAGDGLSLHDIAAAVGVREVTGLDAVVTGLPAGGPAVGARVGERQLGERSRLRRSQAPEHPLPDAIAGHQHRTRELPDAQRYLHALDRALRRAAARVAEHREVAPRLCRNNLGLDRAELARLVVEVERKLRLGQTGFSRR